MKKTLLFLVIFTLFLTSCGDGKKKETTPSQEKSTEVKTATPKTADQVVMGEKLFTEKTCVSCHQIDTKVVGPAIKTIVKVYDEKNGNIVNFLKGTDAAIVDTDPGQVAIMKANLDGFVKDLNNEQLQALEAYMRSAK